MHQNILLLHKWKFEKFSGELAQFSLNLFLGGEGTFPHTSPLKCPLDPDPCYAIVAKLSLYCMK